VRHIFRARSATEPPCRYRSRNPASECVLVSDAGAPFEFVAAPRKNWFSQLGRVRDILIQQTHALRKRMLMADFKAMPSPRYAGAYWGIGTLIEDYKIEKRVCRDTEFTGTYNM
jgi:NTE family protein